MDFLEIINAKVKGSLSREQIEFFVKAVTEKTVPDYQISALLMAIRLKGMTKRETRDLTLAMAHSGEMLHPDVGGIPVDKHSTGGVGDTTTLVLTPLVAACGGKVLKMSGRGLGHTGGTVDKLESIPGFRVTLPQNEVVDIVRKIGCAVVGQSEELAPADKILYALRDVTATVQSVPLITSSILSKKFASGAQAIVLDVKFGSGAIMDTLEDSIKLAQTMVEIGTRAGVKLIAVVSSMEQPLGTHVGNALEVKEAIDILSGRAAGDLKTVSLFLGEKMLVASEVCKTNEEARARLENAIRDGSGLDKLGQMIEAQGGDSRVCQNPSLLPAAPIIKDIYAPCSGYVQQMDTQALGNIAQKMGAGRRTKEDVIDPAVGFVLKIRLGDYVQKGQAIATLHSKDEESFREAEKGMQEAIRYCDVRPSPAPLIYAVITKDGTELFD